MATLPLTPQPEPSRTTAISPAEPQARRAVASVPAYVPVAVALAVLGVVCIWPTALLLWSLWTTDPLKSVGALVPLVSLVLVLRAWRSLGWQTEGSWWGLLLLAGTFAVVQLRQGAVLELVLGPSWSLTLPPHSVVACAYATAVALLAGGPRLWRAARFPLCLTLLVNPVPHVFNRTVDLPLQHASAAVARSLAHALGQRLTPDQLYLMFTPDFGMFIAPGCNGLRGAVTLGLLALVAGYLYRFRLRSWALVVAGAVLLGYLFNLVRLCLLVLFYVVALHWRALQGHAEMADYCIGATLFFFAAVLLFEAIRRFGPRRSLRLPELECIAAPGAGSARRSHAAWMRLGAFASFLFLAAIPAVRASRPAVAAEQRISFPTAIGPYRLRRTWPETLYTGQTIFLWAEYAQPGGGSPAVQVGLSPVLGAHDTLLCHAARGEDWVWRGPVMLETAEGNISFSATLFNDGETSYLEATTVCTAGRCGQWSDTRRHLGLVYSRPHAQGVLSGGDRPVPVLLRVELPSRGVGNAALRQRLLAELGTLSAPASFGAYSYRYLRH